MSTIRAVGFSALALGVGTGTGLLVNSREENNKKALGGVLLASLGFGVALAPHTPPGTDLPPDLARRIEQGMRPFTPLEMKLAKGMWLGGLLMVGFGVFTAWRHFHLSGSDLPIN